MFILCLALITLLITNLFTRGKYRLFSLAIAFVCLALAYIGFWAKDWFAIIWMVIAIFWFLRFNSLLKAAAEKEKNSQDEKKEK